MAVTASAIVGTVGGGHLEHEAIRLARAALAGSTSAEETLSAPVSFEHRYALGPSLGQCCGGVVVLGFEGITASDLPRLQAQTKAHAQAVALAAPARYRSPKQAVPSSSMAGMKRNWPQQPMKSVKKPASP